jgi:hypothetical protein
MSTVGIPLALAQSREEEVMGNYILVALNSIDQIEKIIPRLEAVAQTGMTVIFLIPYQANGCLKNRRVRSELSSKGMPTDRKALMQYSYDKQTRLADEKTSIAGETLHQRGIKVITYVYIGPLRRLLKSYRRTGRVHRVLRPGNAIPMIGFFRGIVSLFSSFKRYGYFSYSYHCKQV